MTLPAHLVSVREAVDALRRSHEEALAALPDAYKKEEYLLRFSTVTESERWKEIHYKYQQEDSALSEMQCITEALELLSLLLERQEHEAAQAGAVPVKLPTLAKTRRWAFGHGPHQK